jgi:hypothetical protein
MHAHATLELELICKLLNVVCSNYGFIAHKPVCLMTLFAEQSPGLPDGYFSDQKFRFGKILEGLGWENVDIFYGHLEYFTDIWNI